MRNTLKAKETNVRVDVTFSFYFVASRGYCDILSDLLVYHCKRIFMKIIGVWERIFFSCKYTRLHQIAFYVQPMFFYFT